MYDTHTNKIGSIALIIGAPIITTLSQLYIHPNFNLAGNDNILYYWIVLQAILFYFVPGKECYGGITPSGEKLKYNINGIIVYPITFMIPVIFDIDIVNNWGAIFIAANLYGLISSLFVYLKGCYHLGSWKCIHEFYAGTELNPRIGNFDIKLFTNGRIGMMSWPLINNLYLAQFYRMNGYVPNSMILLIFLQSLYIVDFFYNEEWYLKTIDIAHDHFGFMMSWGCSVWLPFMYTLQIQYLYHNPIILDTLYLIFVGILGSIGYLVFRIANDQKDYIRNNGNPDEYIEASYSTKDGLIHHTRLVCSGLWKYSRHCNYFGDMILSLSMCLSCGFNDVIPYFYFVYMAILLLHRSERDNYKCRHKYGKSWELYTSRVPYKIIPFVY